MIKKSRKGISIVLLVILGSFAIAAIVVGQAGGALNLSWSTLPGGGGGGTGGRYAVDDSLGQPIASHSPSTDGERYALTDGFWQTGSTEQVIYLPIVIGSGS